MEETYAVTNAETVSIAAIWATAGPALGTCALRACLECERPIEAVTEGKRRLCHRCFGRLMRTRGKSPCVDCGDECWADRCRQCSFIERSNARYRAHRQRMDARAPLSPTQ